MLVPVLSFLVQVSLSYWFESGIKTLTTEVNENFSVLAEQSNDNNLRIPVNEDSVQPVDLVLIFRVSQLMADHLHRSKRYTL